MNEKNSFLHFPSTLSLRYQTHATGNYFRAFVPPLAGVHGRMFSLSWGSVEAGAKAMGVGVVLGEKEFGFHDDQEFRFSLSALGRKSPAGGAIVFGISENCFDFSAQVLRFYSGFSLSLVFWGYLVIIVFYFLLY